MSGWVATNEHRPQLVRAVCCPGGLFLWNGQNQRRLTSEAASPIAITYLQPWTSAPRCGGAHRVRDTPPVRPSVCGSCSACRTGPSGPTPQSRAARASTSHFRTQKWCRWLSSFRCICLITYSSPRGPFPSPPPGHEEAFLENKSDTMCNCRQEYIPFSLLESCPGFASAPFRARRWGGRSLHQTTVATYPPAKLRRGVYNSFVQGKSATNMNNTMPHPTREIWRTLNSKKRVCHRFRFE